MPLFNFFKKKPPFKDAFFGNMRAHVFKRDSLFEVKKWFTPAASEVELTIDADATGPTLVQQDFYKTIERGYSAYVDKIKPLIEAEFGNWKPGFVIHDFAREFTLVHLHIPKQDVIPLIWEMAFTSIHDANHHFTISFEGMEPKSVLIDG